jgi:hypothetical protein
MSGMYDEPKLYEGGNLKPYPHVERPEVRFELLLSPFLFPPSICSRRLPLVLYLISQRGRAKDPVGYLHDVEQRARERQVAYETVKLLRQRVIHCYRKEGVNHYENCRKEAADYYNTIIKKDMGQLQPEWSNPEMKDGW